MITKPIRTLARSLEIANYILLIPATATVFAFSRRLFDHSLAFSEHFRGLLIYPLLLALFYLFGLLLHVLYFQIARDRQLFVRLPMIWGLSALFNLLLTSYFLFFGSFAAWMFVWPLCVTILSLFALVTVYRTSASRR